MPSSLKLEKISKRFEIDYVLKDFNLDMSKSILIGDNISDIEAGKNASVKTNILLDKNNNKIKRSDFIKINSLDEALKYL